MNAILSIMREYFPNAAILPSLGNNDVVLHNQVPCHGSEFNIRYYKELHELWFPSNYNGPVDYRGIKETFLDGGFYAYDFPNSNLTLLALNTLMFIDDNVCNKEGAWRQLNWINKMYKKYERPGKNRKLIFSMHEFNGMNYFNGKF